MRLTEFSDFSLRTLMRLAGEPERRFTTRELADELAISRHHLVKVVAALAAQGLVTTQRGAGGGIKLARPAESITLGEIARPLEARQPLVECFRADGGACVLTPACRLKTRLSAAREAFFATLDASTLAECAYPPQASTLPPGGP